MPITRRSFFAALAGLPLLGRAIPQTWGVPTTAKAIAVPPYGYVTERFLVTSECADLQACRWEYGLVSERGEQRSFVTAGPAMTVGDTIDLSYKD